MGQKSYSVLKSAPMFRNRAVSHDQDVSMADASVRKFRVSTANGLGAMRNYKRKNLGLKPLTEALINEARLMKANGMSLREIGRTLGYDESTIRKRLKAGRGVATLGRFKRVFTPEEEEEMVKHCKDLDSRFYGLTLKSLRFLAFEFAERNGKPHPFSQEKKLAGRDWARDFMKRNHLSLRAPRKTSIARTMGFNKQQVALYFQTLEEVIRTYNFPPNRIYNMDETGVQIVPKNLPKHVAPVGKREVSKNVSAEQGKTVTVACCMSATGHHLPPFFIFAQKRQNPILIKDAPTGSGMAVTDSGYMNTDTFIVYLEHFRKHTNPTQDNPVLLILDNHISHISLQAITWAKSNNIHMLSLPPHSSHKLQPLDRNFFRPFKSYYDALCDHWTVSHPGQVLTEYHIAGLVKQAFQKSATVEKATEGFRVTGIFPFDANIFSEEDFLPAEVTDQEEIDTADMNDPDVQQLIVFEEMPRPNENDALHGGIAGTSEPISNQDGPVPEILEPASLTSNDQFEHSPNRPSNVIQEDGPTAAVSPCDIIPVPKLSVKRKRTGRSLKSTLLTSTPNKTRLEEEAKEKNSREEEKHKKKAQRSIFQSNVRPTKKTVELESSSESDSRMSLDDSSDYSENMFEDETDSDSTNIDLQAGDFAVVKVYGKTKTTFRLYVIKVKVHLADGYVGIFYKRTPQTLRFSPTDEESFFNAEDIVKRLSKPIQSSSARFHDMITFSNDLSELGQSLY